MLDESMAQLCVEWRLRSSVRLRNLKIRNDDDLATNAIPRYICLCGYIYQVQQLFKVCAEGRIESQSH